MIRPWPSSSGGCITEVLTCLVRPVTWPLVSVCPAAGDTNMELLYCKKSYFLFFAANKQFCGERLWNYINISTSIPLFPGWIKMMAAKWWLCEFPSLCSEKGLLPICLVSLYHCGPVDLYYNRILGNLLSFILIFRLSHIWPLGILSSWLLCPYDMCPSFLEHLFTFLHRRFWVLFVLCLLHPGRQRALVLLVESSS